MRLKPQSGLLVWTLVLLLCGQSYGLHQYVPAHHTHHAKKKSRIRRILWNPVFRPSHDSLLRQNAEIDRLELPRIQDDAELQELIANKDLVPIVPSESLKIEPSLDPNRRYCRPWTRNFLEDLSGAYYDEFHSQIQVNSAVRTVKVQKKLRRHNRNAAPYEGDTASSHLAGITVDIQRRGMTRQQIQWVEQSLMPMRDAGLIDPDEERRHWCFHIAVSGRYADYRASKLQSNDPEDEVGGSDSDVAPPDPVSLISHNGSTLPNLLH